MLLFKTAIDKRDNPVYYKGMRQDRIEQIKRKYGANAFRVWGREGGNPLLLAQGQGAKITIHKRSRKKG
jgi:hypothetical protein